MIRKAVIPAAGFGTRFLPAAKAVPKEMAFILDRPAIQWLVEEAVAAGIEEVVVVVSERKEALVRHFRPDPALSAAVAGRPDVRDAMARLERLGEHVQFVTQTEQKGLGHAVLCAAEAVGAEPFAVLLGDALVHATVSATAQLVGVHARTGGCVIGLEAVPRERVSRYGIVSGQPLDDRLHRLADLVEKPAPEEAPSNLAIAGRYILAPDVFDALRQARPGKNGEIQLTDALRTLVRQMPVYGYRYEGVRFDLGNPYDCLRAIVAYARDSDTFRSALGQT